jgi:hypothetical protein
MAKLLLLFLYLLVCLFTPLELAAQEAGKPTFVLTKRSTPDECPVGGVALEEGYISAEINTEYVEVVIYLQRYNNTWDRKQFKRKGSGRLQLDIRSCDYTGNYYIFTCYTGNCLNSIPTAAEVAAKHKIRGAAPKFRIVRKISRTDCESVEDGVVFYEGEVFTPKGERVEVTLFMERQDGGWRKKHFQHTGSGFVPINISDCQLTGKYKTRVLFLNR